jgi:hypothetical protein
MRLTQRPARVLSGPAAPNALKGTLRTLNALRGTLRACGEVGGR